MLEKLNEKNLPYLAALTAIPVAVIRWYYESSMTRLVPTDAQGGIWLAYSAVMSAVTFVAECLTAYGILISLKRRHHVTAAMLAFVFLGIVGWTGNTLRNHAHIRTAFADADNPATSPERLHALIGLRTGFGYALDNRLALNPHSSPETLRALAQRPDQSGTRACLARNPNTPDDILAELFRSGDLAVRDALKLNPRYKTAESLGKEGTNSSARD